MALYVAAPMYILHGGDAGTAGRMARDERRTDGGVEDWSVLLQSRGWDRRKQRERLPSPTVPHSLAAH